MSAVFQPSPCSCVGSLFSCSLGCGSEQHAAELWAVSSFQEIQTALAYLHSQSVSFPSYGFWDLFCVCDTNMWHTYDAFSRWHHMGMNSWCQKSIKEFLHHAYLVCRARIDLKCIFLSSYHRRNSQYQLYCHWRLSRYLLRYFFKY